jgi:hypothetical protein
MVYAIEIKLRAERRAGELLRAMERAKGTDYGGRGIDRRRATTVDPAPTLKALGITRDQSSTLDITEVKLNAPELPRKADHPLANLSRAQIQAAVDKLNEEIAAQSPEPAWYFDVLEMARDRVPATEIVEFVRAHAPTPVDVAIFVETFLRVRIDDLSLGEYGDDGELAASPRYPLLCEVRDALGWSHQCHEPGFTTATCRACPREWWNT